MSLINNLMKPLPLKSFKKSDLPYLPKMWLIIMKLKEDIEEYERNLTDEQLFQRRLMQGWTIPESHRGNWIEKLKQKRVEEYNKMSIYKRLLWQMGLFENPEIEKMILKESVYQEFLITHQDRKNNSSPRIEV